MRNRYSLVYINIKLLKNMIKGRLISLSEYIQSLS